MAVSSVGVMALIGAVALSGCTSSSDTSSANGGSSTDDGQLTIGLAMKTQLQRRWEFDVRAMQAECDALGAKCIVQYANDDPAKQASQVENLLSQQIDVMVLVPVNGDAGQALLAQAHAQGVPVVDYDEFIPGSDFFVTRDNAAVGTAQAEAALKFAPNGNYALIKGDPGNPVAQEINAAYEKVFAGKPIKIVYNQYTKNWDPATAQSAAENVLSANSDNIAAMVTSNDGMASGVAATLQGRDLAGKVFLSGLDADPTNLQLIAAGEQTMTVWTKLDVWGKTAIDAAVALSKGDVPAAKTETEGVPTFLTPIQVVDAKNLCDFVTNVAPEGWTTVDEVYGKSSC
jgi:D-xylose transport system substrate-binding protein